MTEQAKAYQLITVLSQFLTSRLEALQALVILTMTGKNCRDALSYWLDTVGDICSQSILIRAGQSAQTSQGCYLINYFNQTRTVSSWIREPIDPNKTSTALELLQLLGRVRLVELVL